MKKEVKPTSLLEEPPPRRPALTLALLLGVHLRLAAVLFFLALPVMNAHHKVERVVPPKELPAGRALLFLKHDAGAAAYSIVTAKLIQGDTVYQFGQFYSNPGGLELALQTPENIRLAPGQRYGQPELLQDLQIALRQAETLKEPIPHVASEVLKWRRP